MFDKKPNEPFVRAQRRAMDAKWGFFGVVAIAINQTETFRHSEIDLVGRQSKFTSNHAPDLYINLRTVKRRLVRHFDVIDFRIDEGLPDHVLGLFPKLRFIDKFGVVAGQARRIMRAETHHIFLDPKDLEILEIRSEEHTSELQSP